MGRSRYNKKLLELEEEFVALEDFALPEEQPLVDEETKQVTVNYQEELKRFVLELNDYNKFLVGTVVEKELKSLTKVANEVIKQLPEHPEKSVVLRKFVTCYMPMTLKLLSSYQRLVSKRDENKEVMKTMEEIESSLKALENAFSHVLNVLIQEEILEASSDATVLKSILKQDGLLDSDFEGE